MANPQLDEHISAALQEQRLQTEEEIVAFAARLRAYQIIQCMPMGQLIAYVRAQVLASRVSA